MLSKSENRESSDRLVACSRRVPFPFGAPPLAPDVEGLQLLLRASGWGAAASRSLNSGGRGGHARFSYFYEMFDDGRSLSRVLNRLASSDFGGTLSTIRELQNPALRLRALISLCDEVLTGEASKAT